MTPRDGFDHERLEVFQAAIQLAVLIDQVVERIAPGRAELADQLRRASTSVPLNIAEGAGEFSPKEKARFYRMALRSATECGAILLLLERLGLPIDPAPRRLLLRIVPMLVRLCQNGRRAG